MDNFQYRYRNTVSLVISEINGALSSVDVESIERLVEDLYKAEKVFLIGVGLSLIHI